MKTKISTVSEFERSWRTQHQPIVEVIFDDTFYTRFFASCLLAGNLVYFFKVSEEVLEVAVAAATAVVAEVAAVDAVVAVVRRRRIGSL